MYVSSARVRLRRSLGEISLDERPDDTTVWSAGGTSDGNDTTLQQHDPSLYVSVAERVARWPPLISNPSEAHSESECNADLSSITMAVTDHAAQDFPAQHIFPETTTDVDQLLTDLTASRKRNRQLATKLAQVERRLQQLEIKDRLNNDRLESAITVRVVETLHNLLQSQTSGLCDVPFENVSTGSTEESAEALLSYMQRNGCQLPTDRTSKGEDKHDEERTTTQEVGTNTELSADRVPDCDDGQSCQVCATVDIDGLEAENNALKCELETTQARLARAQEELDRLRVELENWKNRNHQQEQAHEERASLAAELEKLRNRYEQSETKWEREAYELRAKFQAADEENFRLFEELQALRRQLDNDPQRNAAERQDDELLRKLTEENQQMREKKEQLERLVTVLRRKLNSGGGGSGASVSSK